MPIRNVGRGWDGGLAFRGSPDSQETICSRESLWWTWEILDARSQGALEPVAPQAERPLPSEGHTESSMKANQRDIHPHARHLRAGSHIIKCSLSSSAM